MVSSALVKDTFKMPGLEELPGGKTKPIGNLTIFKGARILFVLDKELNTARIELENQRIFRLKSYEWDFVKGRLSDIGKAEFRDAARL